MTGSLKSTIDSFGRVGRSPRILVLGDVMLDRYTWGAATRVSPEAPVLVLEADDEEVRLGGAGNVAALLRSLNADVVLAGVTGKDAAGYSVRALLAEQQISCSLVIDDATRPTTVKHRFVGRAAARHPHQILRVDREQREAAGPAIRRQLEDGIIGELESIKAALVTDCGKGVCTSELLRSVIAACRQREIPVVVDPARTEEHERYCHATLLTPNRTEAQLLTGVAVETIDGAFAAGRLLCRECDIDAAAITLDRDGISLVERCGAARHFPTKPRDVYDVTGAGDMVQAVLGFALAAGVMLPDAVEVANVAAGVEVECFGVTPVTWEEIRRKCAMTAVAEAHRKIRSLEEVVLDVERARREGRRIVFTNGCFDLLHVGHAAMLREAASLGDVLIVAVNCDRTVCQLKGHGRPVIGETERACMLANLDCVDHVLIFDGARPHGLLGRIRPDVLVKGGTTDEVVGREIVEGYGGQVVLTAPVAEVSTTRIVTAAQAVAGKTRDEHAAYTL